MTDAQPAERGSSAANKANVGSRSLRASFARTLKMAARAPPSRERAKTAPADASAKPQMTNA